MSFLITALAVTGVGISDLETLFSSLPGQPNIAFIVVAPIPREKISKLANIVSRFTNMQVIKLYQTTRIEANQVYVIAENTVITVADDTITVSERDDDGPVNKIIDTLLLSMAINLGERAVIVFLGGMGHSGLDGAKLVGQNGGYVITKKPDGTKDDEMPGNIIEKDSPNIVLPLEKIGSHLLEIAGKHLAQQGWRPTSAEA